MVKTKEYYYEKLKESVEAKGGRLISPTYILSTTYYDYTCIVNHPCKGRPNQIKSKLCKECVRISGKTPEQLFREAVELKGGTVIGLYACPQTWVQCAEEDHPPWHARVADVKNGHWCKKCAGLCPEDSERKFREQVETRGGRVIGSYAGDKVLVDLLCEVNHSFRIRPNDVKDGHWCSWCADRSPDQTVKNINQIMEEEGATLLTPYIKRDVPMTVLCSKGHIKSAYSPSIYKRNWCTDCGGSSYERKAVVFLEENNIPHRSQYVIPQLPKKRYDFYFEYNGFKYILEIDGEQHFMFKALFHKTSENLIYKKDIDRLKTKIAIEFGYRLIRIDYSEIPNIAQHMKWALEGNYPMYLSSRDKYEFLHEKLADSFIIQHSRELAVKLGLS